ncbi:MAG TPA: hypothetical protein VFX93_03685, partial [Xanthomonadaceae bacterium]|nr:hypothetical protein [Xanthomonadaceae bacterium]
LGAALALLADAAHALGVRDALALAFPVNAGFVATVIAALAATPLGKVPGVARAYGGLALFALAAIAHVSGATLLGQA